MSTDDFFRARLDSMIDMRHPLAVLATRMPWAQIEAALAPALAHKDRSGTSVQGADLFGPSSQVVGAGVSARGRPRLPVRLMVSLLYLKHAFNESDESLVERWSENVYWQFFSGMTHFEPRLPCDATQIGRFRRVLGEAGVEELLKSTIDTALGIKAVKPSEFERVIVDTTVQEKAIAHPVDSRLLEIARHKVVQAAKRAGLMLRQTFAKEGRDLRRKAGGYAHAKQFRRLKRTLKRQRTILGIVIRDARRKLEELHAGHAGHAGIAAHVPQPLALTKLQTWLERAERIRTQQRHSKHKLYALHAPEVECISKGKARKPYEFGVKVSLAVTHRNGLMVGARSFPGNPYDGHTLAEQLEQTNTLLEGIGVRPGTAIVDLGFRGVDDQVAPVQLIHRGKHKSLTDEQRRWLRRRQAIEPAIGHTKSDHRMDRCWLQGSLGDALHALLCAAGYNIRWLLRAIVRKGLGALLLALIELARYAASSRANSITERTSPLVPPSACKSNRWWRPLGPPTAAARAS
jgi:transposase, IS5 family